MELAAALHHVGLRAQKTAKFAGARPGVLKDLEPEEGAVTVGYVAAPVPLLAVPLLAGAAGEAVDARTLSFLLARSLAEKEEDEERRGGRWRRRSTRSACPGRLAADCRGARGMAAVDGLRPFCDGWWEEAEEEEEEET